VKRKVVLLFKKLEGKLNIDKKSIVGNRKRLDIEWVVIASNCCLRTSGNNSQMNDVLVRL